MFKPHYGICICHGQKRLIVVKKGYCQQGNDERKGKSRDGSMQKRSGLLHGKACKGKRFVRISKASGDNRVSKGMAPVTADEQRQSAPLDTPRKAVRIQRQGKIVSQVQPPLRKKASKIQYRKKGTGEAKIFAEIWEEAVEAALPDGCPKCRCCDASLGLEARSFNFSHLLPKSTYPALRLEKRNIWLKCWTCHNEWEFGDRSQIKFAAAVAEANRLKTEYNRNEKRI